MRRVRTSSDTKVPGRDRTFRRRVSPTCESNQVSLSQPVGILAALDTPEPTRTSVDAPIGLNREGQRVDRINHSVSISICFVRNPSEMILGSIGPQPDGTDEL